MTVMRPVLLVALVQDQEIAQIVTTTDIQPLLLVVFSHVIASPITTITKLDSVATVTQVAMVVMGH